MDYDKEMKDFGFDVKSAMQYSEQGKIEEWVHKYCTTGNWANHGLSEGLNKTKRWWNGPLEIELSKLKRKVGPEKGMDYEVSDEYWNSRIALMSDSFNDPNTIPPLIATYENGKLFIADGNTRCGTMQHLGWEKFWVIIWYNSENDYIEHSKILKK